MYGNCETRELSSLTIFTQHQRWTLRIFFFFQVHFCRWNSFNFVGDAEKENNENCLFFNENHKSLHATLSISREYSIFTYLIALMGVVWELHLGFIGKRVWRCVWYSFLAIGYKFMIYGVSYITTELEFS